MITCALEGRDLAVVKSLLNIQKEYAGVSFQYTDAPRKGQILILKDYHDQGAVYYALNRQNGNKTPILPNLNPKTLKDLFNSIAQRLDGNDFIDNIDEFKPFENILFDFMHANSKHCLSVKQGHETLCCNKIQNRVYSTAQLISQIDTLKALGTHKHIMIDTEFHEADEPFPYSMPLDLFCWQFGISMGSNLLTENMFEDLKYKLISWPNFGEFEFQQEFICLSSLIWKSAETISEILERTGFEQQTVYQFLNAGLLTGHVAVFKDDTVRTIQPKIRKTSGFLSGVKKVFGF